MSNKQGNIEFFEDYVIVHLNPELYSLDAIFLAGFQLIEKAYVILDGDIDDELLIKLVPKDIKNLKIIGWEFSNELLSSQVYDMMSAKNAKIKEQIVEKALEIVDDERDINQPEGE